MEIKIFLGITATIIAFVSYIPYFRNVFLGKTKPHAFSWLIWGILTGIAFAGQIIEGGGAGAWVTGFTSLASFSIFILALSKGEKNITRSDWVSLIGAGVALVLWYLTKDPLLAMILVTVIHSLGFFSTFRKSFNKPHEETLATFLLSAVKFSISIFALEAYTVITLLYPIALVFMNGTFVMLLVIRRGQINKSSNIVPRP